MKQGSVAGLVLGIAAALSGCRKGEQPAQQAGSSMGGEGADYRIVVKSTWTAATHPFEYATAGALTGPHFSGLIGASHNAGYTVFAEGTPPTPGLERLSEEGKHNPLDDEIRAAIAAGTAGVLVESGPLRDFSDSLVATIHVDSQHPMVSLVMMVAPSPDWFTGVASVPLMENGQWVAATTVDLIAWDSGGDDGTTYKASDRDANPKQPASRGMTPHFVVNGSVVPVGTLTITRQ